nr:branched-chain amino acid ABC transporter permease [uncultured Undibacterium sp.]
MPKRFWCSSSFFVAVLISGLLISAPLLWPSNAALNFLTQVCITVVLALSFNLLLGQTGLLSFGHAVYAGFGAYAAIYALNQVSAGIWFLPVSLVPIIGGLSGLFFGMLFGWISSKQSGLTFSMISLGIGELVFAGSAMFPTVFGGEGGKSANRVVGETWMGITFGPQIEITYLIIFWTLIAAGTMFFVTRTPLGKLANAVKDNEERVAFLGVNPRYVRFLMLCISCFFAGVAGALSALHFEMATTDSFSLARSGAILFFTYIGGVSVFLGPVVGAILAVVMSVFLSELTPAWQLYLGLLFMLVVSLAPHGVSGMLLSWIDAAKNAKRQSHLSSFLVCTSLWLSASTFLCCGGVMMIELLYRWRFPSETFHPLAAFGLTLAPHNISSWLITSSSFVVGLVALKMVGQCPRRGQQ